MLGGVVASNAEVAAVLAETKREHALVNDLGVVHCFVNWFLLLDALRVPHCHSEDSVCFLVVKQICFLRDAAEREHKRIVSKVVRVTEVNLVFNHEPSVAGALHVSLVELAFAVVRACAFLLQTVEGIPSCALIEGVVVVDVFSTGR